MNFGQKKTAEKKAAPAPSKPQVKSTNGKAEILTGLFLIGASFAGVIFVLYLSVTAQNAKEAQAEELGQKLVIETTEKEVAVKKAKKLEQEVGRVLDIDRVVTASKAVHGEKEADRKSGTMWIDRKTKKFIVTLGVLNGVKKGSRLVVLEDDKEFAELTVKSALDVVSYAEPVEREIKDFAKDYYSVKLK